MKEEFNLSKKRMEHYPNGWWVHESSVKEFIKLLKGLSRKIEGAEGDWVNLEVIKEHAGEDLV